MSRRIMLCAHWHWASADCRLGGEGDNENFWQGSTLSTGKGGYKVFDLHGIIEQLGHVVQYRQLFSRVNSDNKNECYALYLSMNLKKKQQLCSGGHGNPGSVDGCLAALSTMPTLVDTESAQRNAEIGREWKQRTGLDIKIT